MMDDVKSSVPCIVYRDDNNHLTVAHYNAKTVFLDGVTITDNRDINVRFINAPDHAYMCFMGKDFDIMYDADTNLVTFIDRSSKRIIWKRLDVLKDKVNREGHTIDEVGKAMKYRKRKRLSKDTSETDGQGIISKSSISKNHRFYRKR